MFSSSSSVYLQSLCGLSLSLFCIMFGHKSCERKHHPSSSLILYDFSVSLKKGHPNYQPAGLFVLRGPAHDVSQCSEVPECKPVRPQAACLYLCRNERGWRLSRSNLGGKRVKRASCRADAFWENSFEKILHCGLWNSPFSQSDRNHVSQELL